MILYLAQLLQQAVVLGELQRLTMLDQEVQVAVAVDCQAAQIPVALVTPQRHLLTVETAHLQRRDKEILEEPLLVKDRLQQVVAVDQAV
jgi:hypothetical protein